MSRTKNINTVSKTNICPHKLLPKNNIEFKKKLFNQKVSNICKMSTNPEQIL